jgi:hypothetical protein
VRQDEETGVDQADRRVGTAQPGFDIEQVFAKQLVR